jgi:hypothetical protein
MADVIKENSKLGCMKEVTEGTYVAPAGDTDFIETTEDGATIEGTREKKDRNVMSGDRVKRNFRLSKRDVSASVPLEFKAGDTEGVAPKWTEMLEAMGMSVDTMTSSVTSGASHTTSVINVSDTSEFSVNQIVMIKEAGDYHVSPIKSIVTDTSIELLVPMASAPADSVVIAKATNFQFDKTVNQTLSLTKIYEGDETELRATGCRTTEMALSNFITGEYPQLAFSLVGLNFSDILNSSAFSPSYDESEPPLILGAKAYKDGSEELCLNEIGLSITNNVSIKTCTGNENGNVSSRGTGKLIVSGTMNPFKKQDAIDFELNESEFSLFFFAANPTATEGEKEQVIAVHIPKVRLTAKVDADNEGILVDSLTWEATPDSEADSIRIALI